MAFGLRRPDYLGGARYHCDPFMTHWGRETDEILAWSALGAGFDESFLL